MSGTAKKRKKPARKPAATKRRTSTPAGAMESVGAYLDVLWTRAVHAVVTYTAVFAVGLVIIAVMMLFAGGYFFNVGGRLVDASREVARASGFEVTTITLKGGQQVRREDVVKALYNSKSGQALGQSLLHYDAETARGSVEKIGWVRHAAVAKLWPDTLHVSVEERIPAALWQRIGTGELYLIDRDGQVITEVGGHQYTGLPMILNTDRPVKAQAILTALTAHPSLRGRVAGLRHQGDRRWDLVFRNDFVVMLPEEGFKKALAQLAKLETGKGKPSEAGEYLNMRDNKTVYFKPKA